ncbi:multidrug resistance-associated protein 1-like [Pomacea canaliculata]|uniref:multidrug resistance-associated protein 1-like n=1 Tax=Pomacea canaliculata TaxID=400727 RepID=UPI000D73128C|nr:multidrug resistance-associated protein 1-like [Pomacea canaliculata]
MLLGLLIEQVTSPDDNDKQARSGYVLAVLMFLVYMVRTLLASFSFWCSQVVGMQLKTILIAAIYKKSLTMNSAARRLAASGEITNLMSVDCQRIQDSMFYFVAWTTPLQAIIVVGVLYFYIGPSVFAGVIVLLLLVPLNSYISSCQKKLNISNLKFKDKRLRLTNDMLSGMRVVKMYAWEPSFKKLITDLRSEETNVLLRISYLNMFMSVCCYFAPFLVTLATLATFVVVSPDNHLDARRVFVTLALLNLLRDPLDLLAKLISLTAQSLVSVQRINKFLCCEDLDTDNVTRAADSVDAISIRNGTFTWDKHYEPVLKNIDISVGVGRLVAVVGHVGSGKSSLISSLLGEIEKVSGKVTIKSSVAYVPQQAWIQNKTLRDNILFGKLFNEQRYQQVLRACALERDLAILPAGDMTEIGERGINLSGGQKQRVSLARAVYSDSDIYLLDDPLSAVDSHVGKHIFTEVIGPNGLLRHKTRVLVTHGIHWLPMVDEIIVLSDNGISEKGSYDTLMSHDGPFARFLKLHLQQKEESEEAEDPEISALIRKIRENVETATSEGTTSGEDLTCKDNSRRRKSTRTTSKSSRMTDSMKCKFSTCHLEDDTSQEDNYRLVKEETIEKGNVKTSVFLTYIRAAGAVPFTASILFFLLFQAVHASSNFWLSRWTDDNFLATSHVNATLRHNYNAKNDYYLMVFGMFGIGQMATTRKQHGFQSQGRPCLNLCSVSFRTVVTLVLSNFLIWVRTVVASKNLHSRLLASVLRAPMVFFDTNPVGRIINRFSRDIDTIDNIIPNNIQESVSIGTMVLVTIIVISISTPLFIFLVIPVIIVYFLIQTFYIPTSRQLKRMESVTHSPIYVHFSETISGGATIRAYRAVDRFIEEIKRRVDRNQSLYYASLSAHRWMTMNIEIITNLIIFGAAICSIVTPGIGEGTLGFSVTYAMQMSDYISWMVRKISDLVTNMVSVERVREYSQLESEAPWTNPLRRPDPSWPERGRLLFSEYSTRYRPGLDLVLRDISFIVEAGQKVGIVGRTGAGKSSMTLSLFRLIEACNGCIMIDGVNIADIGLHDLRSRITILPQDPVLFSGTLRMNLDPLDQYSDDQIWKALETAQLKRFAEELPENLNHQVGEGGQKLSVGQRQLVCLARSLLRRTKLLVLDEATAAVDMETDSLIQNTIRQAFSSCTIITIAHRLNTIMDYDRILVLDEGLVKEYDSPHVLLADRMSIFYGMAKDAGLV